MTLPPLPIDEILPELTRTLREHSSVVLHAPPGAGKTTRVAPAIRDAGIVGDSELILLQPRRIAARSSARRIAFELGERVGDSVGYQVRFDSCVGRNTTLRVVTDGILLRRLHDDPFLEGVGVVLFDEFHERRLECDVALGMVRRIQQSVRPELKIVVMSATLAAEPIAAYLSNCPIVRSEGRMYPVAMNYRRRADRRPLPEQVAEAVRESLPQSPGDLLVFLPGVGEILKTARELESLAARESLDVLPLYGDLPAEEQDRVLAPSPRRKVVLATNVAETSLTIDGITAVIDSGQARVMRFDPGTGLDRLELTPISKASADQRSGRAGRTQPGVCLRLWEESQQRIRPEFETPEIHRVDLSGIVLQLRAWGETDLAAFPWYEVPAPDALRHAHELLEQLGALHRGAITEMGRTMVCLPVPPRIARLLIAGHRLGFPESAARVAALLTERSPFLRHDRTPSPHGPRTTIAHTSRSDVLDLLHTLEETRATGRRDTSLGTLNPGAAHAIDRVTRQLMQLLQDQLGEAAEPVTSQDEAILWSLLAAYPDRLARRRDGDGEKAVMVGGRGVKLGPLSAVREHPLFLCIDVDDRSANAVVRMASAVERAWLSDANLRTDDELFLHPSQKQVVARRRTYWLDLLIEETNLPVPDPAEAADVLFREAVKNWSQVFPHDDRELTNFLTRGACLHVWRPKLDLPAVDQPALEETLRTLCASSRSFAELKKAQWLATIQSSWTYTQRQTLDREAPERIEVPSGNRIRLEYEPGRPPVLAVRIQEIFGLRETPTVAGGRVKVLLHLLAPNMRPQQVTDDLPSFWANTYAEVRKDLRRRYPKHAWPDDPLTAPPQRKRGR